jgi:LysM domain
MSTATIGLGGYSNPTIRPRLRLTRRGRAGLLFLAATPLVIAALLFALNGGQASASLEGSSNSFQYVTVDGGESLWQVAQEIAPNADPRDVIQQLMQLNQLDSADVFAGVQLAIPAQYAR